MDHGSNMLEVLGIFVIGARYFFSSVFPALIYCILPYVLLGTDSYYLQT
jgi:hypothetical protein